MSDEKETQPGAMDDDALARAKENKKKKSDQLKAIFDDNTTGRYGKATDK